MKLRVPRFKIQDSGLKTRVSRFTLHASRKTFHVSRFTFHEKGYSLIELMVAIGIFATVMAIMSSMFMTSLRGQKKAVTVQNVADNTRYAMEIMSKEIRMGSAFNPVSPTQLQFKSNMPNRGGAIVELSLVGGQILFDDDIAAVPAATPITSSNNIKVTGLNFSLYPAIGTQKRVLISLQATSAGAAPDTATSINLQITVAPRIIQ